MVHSWIKIVPLFHICTHFPEVFELILFFANTKLNHFFFEEYLRITSKWFADIPKKKMVLKNFANFAEKHQCSSLFFKKLTPRQAFSTKFAEFLRTPFFNLWWLLLDLDQVNVKVLHFTWCNMFKVDYF